MKLLNTENIQSLAGYSHRCECGAVHKITTEEIVFEEGGLGSLYNICKRYIGEGGKILALFDGDGLSHKPRVLQALAGFNVAAFTLTGAPKTSYAAKFFDAPDDIRLIIGVGRGGVCDVAKYIAAAISRIYIAVPTTITSDAFLSPAAVLYQNGFKEVFKTPPPRAIVCDLDIVLNAKANDVAAAYGSLSAKHISVFDWKIANILCAERFCSQLSELAQSLPLYALSVSDGAWRLEKSAIRLLAEQNLRSGLYMQLAAGSRISCGAETHAAHALEMLFSAEERQLLPYGMNLMLCALFIARVYAFALSRSFGRALPVPDNTLRLECLNKFLGAEKENAVKKLRGLQRERDLEIRGYRLSGFKDELASEINSINKSLTEAYRYFKRILPDSGYSLSTYLDPADFKLILPLAPDLNKKFTLLSHLKDMGLLDKYLPLEC